MKLVVGVLYSLLPEIVLLVAAALLARYLLPAGGAGLLATELVALFILLATLALSVQFNRRGMFFALLSLLLAYGALLTLAGSGDPMTRRILAGGVDLFLPFNLLWMHALAERGVFSRYGAWPFGLLLIEVVFVAALIGSHAQGVADALFVEFVHWSALSATGISQPGLVCLVAGFLWVNDRLLRRHSPELAAFFLALAVAAVMLHSHQPATVAVFAAAAGVAFGWAVVTESWNMAYVDELTGLPGRRALEENLRRLGGRYVIAMLDVDHFKRFNDNYGHDTGDQVLRLVASRLQKSAGGGKPFRYGGEEFSLLYPGKNLQEVAPLLENLRGEIETSGFNPRRGERRSGADALAPADADAALRVTVSIGAAESDGARADPWSVLGTADRALYEAKHAGRNRICLAGA